MLLREGATLALTSQLTAYVSEASFGHAFRQWSGMAPGAYRRQLPRASSSPHKRHRRLEASPTRARAGVLHAQESDVRIAGAIRKQPTCSPYPFTHGQRAAELVSTMMRAS
jgi:hypothetical protein